uniref:WASH complex subunit 3 n=1 Tax=Ciona intestinalis TaxID=7719 RepID=F6UXP7_CIOIN|nr:WASH complex subunit 3-like [Ciona intestinalis]|eukprot:XP_018672724.1 WASH complex subunit 3-like [Ciona intestinalis]
MESNGLPLTGPDVDLNKIPALNHRRSVTFMNHFITHTSNFLNNFAAVTDEQLAKQSLEMQKLEIALKILEAKLDSIPGLDDVKPKPKPNEPQENPASEDQKTASSEAPPPAAPDAEEEPPVVENFIKVKDDPRYAKYLKMVMVGVPKPAIANKMRLDGLDPALLDTPDAPAPGAAPQDDSSSDDSEAFSSDDEFSD